MWMECAGVPHLKRSQGHEQTLWIKQDAFLDTFLCSSFTRRTSLSRRRGCVLRSDEDPHVSFCVPWGCCGCWCCQRRAALHTTHSFVNRCRFAKYPIRASTQPGICTTLAIFRGDQKFTTKIMFVQRAFFHVFGSENKHCFSATCRTPGISKAYKIAG